MYNKRYISIIISVLMLFLFGCDNSPDLEYDQERFKVTLQGSFVTESPDTLLFPVKVIFAIDCSLSMGDMVNETTAGSDPYFLRIQAVRNFVQEYYENENVSFEVMLWNNAISDATRVTNSAGQTHFGFTRNLDELNRVLGNVNIDSMTDYLGTIAQINIDIEQDILDTINDGRQDTLSRTKYVVVFLSDGMSNVASGNDDGTSVSQADGDIWDGVTLITEKIEQYGVGGVNFHTFLLTALFGPSASDQYVQGLCENTLQGMAQRGNGHFSIFETAQSIDFVNVVDMRLSAEYTVKYIVACNYNVSPGSEIVYIDSDGDGLTDAEEESYGSNPALVDSDNDGMSDYFENRLSSPGNELYPDVPDSPCDMTLGFWPDSDEDGLTDCEEFVKGTDRYVADSDADGIPDGLEFRMGTNPLAPEDMADSDFDGTVNSQEVQQHTNVTSNDPKIKERYSYLYDIQDMGLISLDQGTSMESYVRRYDFSISNIDIMNTNEHTAANGAQMQEGDNHIRLYIAEVPEDRPETAPIFRMADIIVNMNDSARTITLTPGDFTLIQ